jgi:hypothetical protein
MAGPQRLLPLNRQLALNFDARNGDQGTCQPGAAADMIRPMAKFDAERFSRPLTYIITGRLRYILQREGSASVVRRTAGIVSMNDSKGDRWTVK